MSRRCPVATLLRPCEGPCGPSPGPSGCTLHYSIRLESGGQALTQLLLDGELDLGGHEGLAKATALLELVVVDEVLALPVPAHHQSRPGSASLAPAVHLPAARLVAESLAGAILREGVAAVEGGVGAVRLALLGLGRG